MKNSIILVSVLFLSFSCSFQNEKIEQSILTELEQYPEARLTDIYKNFFQDAFGPGHLIPDTASAGAYLDWEMKEPLWGDTLKWQALGSTHSFYRINLILVKQGTIPREVLLEGMVKSVPLARKPDIESWEKEWDEVLEVIGELKLDLPGFEADKKVIEDILGRGEVVIHHSKQYTEMYHPHYRIVHRTVFKEWGKKYLK